MKEGRKKVPLSSPTSSTPHPHSPNFQGEERHAAFINKPSVAVVPFNRYKAASLASCCIIADISFAAEYNPFRWTDGYMSLFIRGRYGGKKDEKTKKV